MLRAFAPGHERLTIADAASWTSAGVLDGSEVVYVLCIPSARLLHLGVSAGTRLPAHVSSMRRVLLAALPVSALDAYFRTIVPALPAAAMEIAVATGSS